MDILNSEFTQKILKWGLSKAGIAARALAGMIVGSAWFRGTFNEGDITKFQFGIEQSLLTVAGILFGLLEWWIQHRQKDGVRVVQTQLNTSVAPSKEVQVDGILGNETIKAAASVTGVPADVAIASVKS